MAWHTVVIAVLALALACDLYLRGRALLKEHGRARGLLTWNENRRAFYELAGREFERARRYDHPFTLGYFDLDDYQQVAERFRDRKSTRLNSSHVRISYAVFCLKKKKNKFRHETVHL